jgi:hypothetical protein
MQRLDRTDFDQAYPSYERRAVSAPYAGQKYLAKVTFQPDGQESGWLPKDLGITAHQLHNLTVKLADLPLDGGTDVGRTNQDVVVGVVSVNAQMAARPQLAQCSRHNLHQSHGALFRSSSLFATAFDAHNGAYPMFRHSEAPRRLDDECREGMDGQIVWPARSRRALPGMRCAPQQHRCCQDRNDAHHRPERSQARRRQW